MTIRNALGAAVAALFGSMPKVAYGNTRSSAPPSTDSLNEDARQYRLAKAVAEARERGLEVGDDSAIARLAAEYAVAPTDIMAQLPNRIGEALDYCERPEVQANEAGRYTCDNARDCTRCTGQGEGCGQMPPFPPIETPSGSVPLDVTPVNRDCLLAGYESAMRDFPVKAIDVPPGTPVVATPDWTKPLGVAPLSLKGDVQLLRSGRVGCSRCGNDAANLQTLVHGPSCTRAQIAAAETETEAQRRTRLLAEWEAHRAAEPMAAGRVPGEPMPRTEAELIGQAFLLLNRRGAGGLPNGEHLPHVDDMRLFFSMALTYCRFERAHFYEEHDGNRLVASMVRSAKGMA
jgi:hypothetical protein